MDPYSYGVTGPEPAQAGRELELLDYPEYDPRSRTFTLVLKLPHDWNGEVRLVGFRSADGANVAPVAVPYRTRRELLAPSLRARLERAARDDTGLVRFLERVQAARRDRHGIREDVITTLTSGPGVPGWHRTYETSGATFAMRDDRHFYAEIDEIMGIPFRIGCDGETCWFRHDAELTTLPVDEVAERHLNVGDPFLAAIGAKATDVIRDRKLEDLGETNAFGRPCRHLRSWDVQLVAAEMLTYPIDWYIDVQSLLPIRIEAGPSKIDLDYPHLGEPIPDELFRKSTDTRIRETRAEPLATGSHRFLSAIDGGEGRMSVRWGSKGPAGTISSGLN
jgi:hypothetical protein